MAFPWGIRPNIDPVQLPDSPDQAGGTILSAHSRHQVIPPPPPPGCMTEKRSPGREEPAAEWNNRLTSHHRLRTSPAWLWIDTRSGITNLHDPLLLLRSRSSIRIQGGITHCSVKRQIERCCPGEDQWVCVMECCLAPGENPLHPASLR